MRVDAGIMLWLGRALAGRSIAAYLWPKQLLTNWGFAAIGTVFGFIAAYFIFPPRVGLLVVDPGIVVLVLPLLAGTIAAAIEFLAQLVWLVREKDERRQTLRNLTLVFLIGASCGFALFVHERLNKFPPPPAPIPFSPDSN